ncbi:hypothetical protein [Lysinibacillus fusiformis]|uniref:hypothetical protein n=1 Tax=Lysinibacillus fusiformis TaxID=28031 RepID=UPI001FB07A86|nr:hypothetical protein [Lysinibacillus fusiformis]
MLSKRLILWIAAIFLGISILMLYTEYRTKDLLHDFLPNKDLEEILNKMAIWEVDNGTNKTLAIINRDDPRLDDMRLALSTWEVKRTLLNNKQADVVYQLDITYYDNTLKILFFQNGLLAIDGQTYKLVNGETLDEILKAIH